MTDSPAPPTNTNEMGRHERPADAFEKLSKANAGSDVHTMDIATLFPDYIGNDKGVPPSLLKICRMVLDSTLTESKGIYCYRKTAARIDIHFDDIPYTSGRLKIDHAVETIREKVKKHAAGENVFDSEKKEDAKKGYGNEALSRIMHEGLGPNPSLEEVIFWIDRLIPNIQHGQGKTPLTPDLVNMIKTSEVAYAPILSPGNQLIVGGFCTIKPPCPASQYNTGELIRQHIIMFSSGCMEIFRLATQQGQGLVTIPLSCNDLQNETIINLYLCMLRKLAPEMRKNLVFEIVHLPRGPINTSLKNTIQTLLPFCKTLMVESGFLTLSAVDPVFKAHACGFDLSSFTLPPEELGRLLQKFTAHHTKQNVRTYIKNISNPAALNAVKQSGITYISGPAVMPTQKSCPGIQKLGTPGGQKT